MKRHYRITNPKNNFFELACRQFDGSWRGVGYLLERSTPDTRGVTCEDCLKSEVFIDNYLDIPSPGPEHDVYKGGWPRD